MNVSFCPEQDDIPLSFREVHHAVDWPQVCSLGGVIDPPAHGVFCWVTLTRESFSVHTEVPTSSVEKEKVAHITLDGLDQLPALCSCDYLAMVITNDGAHGKGFGGNNSCGQKKVQLVFTPGVQISAYKTKMVCIFMHYVYIPCPFVPKSLRARPVHF